MRQLLLISLIGCRSAAPPPVHHATAPLPAPAPSGVRPITQDVIDQLATERPFDEEAAGILRTDATPDWIGATIDDAFYPIVRLGNRRWAAAAKPLERGGRFKLERVFDASSLTQHAMGYVVSSYDGGSETGTERATLHLVCADAKEVRACGSVEIGHFVWALAAEDRRNATSLDKRPHVEVRLKPAFEAPDGIRLTVAKDTGATAQWEEAREDLGRVRANAGRWTMTRGTLVQQP